MRRTLPLAALAAVVACEPSERPPQSAAPQAPIAAVSAPAPAPPPPPTAAAEPSAPAPEIRPADVVGQCGYNPSDNVLIGRVVRLGPEGVNAYDQPEAGQRAATVRLTPAKADLVGKPEIRVTYPRFLVVRPCP